MTDEPQDWAQAHAMLAQYQAAAQQTAQMLVEACRENNPQAGAHIVQQLFDKNDITYWMLTVGQLTMRVVNAERRAIDPNGPIVTPDETGDTVDQTPQPWATSVTDQLEAAVEEQNYEAFARVAVDGQIRSFGIDAINGYEVNFDHILKQMLMLNRYTLAISAAEMMRRLLERNGDGSPG